MDMTQVVDWSREALRMALLMGGPLLAVALVVGLVVGVGQTLTQMSEPAAGQVAAGLGRARRHAGRAPLAARPMGRVYRRADRVDPGPALRSIPDRRFQIANFR